MSTFGPKRPSAPKYDSIRALLAALVCALAVAAPFAPALDGASPERAPGIPLGLSPSATPAEDAAGALVIIRLASERKEVRVLLHDFAKEEERASFYAINDGVMGGISDGGLVAAEDGRIARFEGLVRLENNGGFASIRSQPRSMDLSAFEGLVLRVRGDGKRYKLNLRTDDRFDGLVHRAAFTPPEGEWAEVRVPFSAFEPSFRGRRVTGVPALDPARIISIGFLISDKQRGPFSLDIARIEAYGEDEKDASLPT